jgi:short subunit fatty acids transporter
MGMVWEFLEWGFDLMVGTTLQRGLYDTMLDLLFDTVAGIVIGTVSALKLSRGEPLEEQAMRGE